MSTAASQALVQKLYVAYYGRPADPAGLEAWALAIDANKGQVSTAIVNAFGASAESTALFGNMSTSQKVNAIYKQLFGRDAEPAGLLAWATAIDGGRVSAAGAALEILNGAAGDDKTTINNKLSAAAAFTAALDTTAEITAYSGDTVANAARSFLAGVTTAAPSTDAVNTAVASVTNTSGSGSNEAGKSYVLTTAQDVLTGTNSGDFFRAVAGVDVNKQDQTTLNSSDIIDGGAGADSLIVNMTGPAYNGGARIKNVETLQVGTNLAAATFDYNVNAGFNEVTGVKTIVADQINTGEALTINNLVRDTADTAIPTVSWVNDNTGANGLAGTVNVNYRAGTVAGAADEQAVSLTNVRAGTLNLAAGIEKVTLTSAGTATNAIVQIASGDTLTDVVIKADAQLGGARKISTDDATRGLEINQAPTNDNTETTSFVNLGASVKTVTAEGSKAGVNVAFTDTKAVDNTFTGGDGNDTVILNGGNDKLAGGKGDDTFIFHQTNTSANGLFFNNSDTIDGGDGKDTILIDYAKDSASVHANGVTLQTSEWLNSKGVDVLDIRSLTTRVQLDDAFVGRADAGSFEVITNKIVQNDSVKSVADEANSRTQIDLTTVGASRLVKVTGGEGRETVIVTDALNGVQTISGGNGLDVLVVQNNATLTGQDLANVSGVNVFNLVKTGATAQTFNIDLTTAFLDAAIDKNVVAGTSKNVANAFRVITDTHDANATAINGIQSIAAGDVVNITLDTTGLTTAGAINLNDLIFSNANVTVRDTSGATLLAANNGAVTTNTGIFAGATAAENTAYTDLAANPIAGVGTPLASGQTSGSPVTPPDGSTVVVLTVGSSAPVTADAAKELFTLNVAGAKASTPNTQITVNAFDVTKDALQIDLEAANAGITKLSQLNGVEGIAVQNDPFTNSTLINFGADADGTVISVTLVGIADTSLVNVTVI
jgi:hypothetical protein